MTVRYFDLNNNEIADQTAPCYVAKYDADNNLISKVLFTQQAQQLAQVPLTNVNIVSNGANASDITKVGEIWWCKRGAEFTLTADVPLPDSNLMVMIERVVDGSNVIDDLRVIANIQNGVVTMIVNFENSGNYQITAERLNRGLARIGQPLELVFDKIEFDAYA